MSALKTPLPVRKRTYRFALTPLADAMFQLLIFFMLTSSLTPYSLITLRSAPDTPVGEETASTPIIPDASAPAAPPQSTQQGTIWHIYEGRIEIGAQSFDIQQVSDLAQALGAQAASDILTIVLSSDARVQDIASTMAALKGADVSGVQITREATQ
jgi:biopolymer transport protein ExbD